MSDDKPTRYTLLDFLDDPIFRSHKQKLLSMGGYCDVSSDYDGDVYISLYGRSRTKLYTCHVESPHICNVLLNGFIEGVRVADTICWTAPTHCVTSNFRPRVTGKEKYIQHWTSRGYDDNLVRWEQEPVAVRSYFINVADKENRRNGYDN
jgi:hypothetical protein